MRVRRTLPPAAAPLDFRDIWSGFKGFLAGETYLKRLEDEIKEYFGVSHVFFTSSGKSALYLILRALKSLRPERSEVLIPAYTCFSVPSAIVRAGLNVALCDIDVSSLDFNYALLKDNINKDTLCVVPNHLFGIPSSMDHIMELCGRRDVFVLEDAAQAMGGTHNGRLLGTIGNVGFFSLGRGKAVTCGSGGIIVTNSNAIARAIEAEFSQLSFPGRMQDVREYIKVIMMNLFIRPSLYWIPMALPFLKLGRTFFDSQFPVMRLSPMQAGLCLTWRQRLEKAMSVRKKQAAALCDRLKATEWLNGDSPVPYLRLPLIIESQKKKKSICDAAAKKGLGITHMYPFPVNEVPEIAHRFNGHTYPAARLVAGRLITIPLHEFVSERDQEEMTRLLAPARVAEAVRPARSLAMTSPIPGLAGKGKAC